MWFGWKSFYWYVIRVFHYATADWARMKGVVILWENRQTRRQRLWNIWHAKHLDLSAIQNPAVWNEFWLNNTYDDLHPMRESDTRQQEVQGGVIDLNISNPCSPASPQTFPHLFFFFFALSLQINAKTICIMNFLLAIILITFPVLHKNSDLTCDLALFPYHFLRIWLWNVVCGPDRVVGDSSYCKVMQCVTSCCQSNVNTAETEFYPR